MTISAPSDSCSMEASEQRLHQLQALLASAMQLRDQADGSGDDEGVSCNDPSDEETVALSAAELLAATSTDLHQLAQLLRQAQARLDEHIACMDTLVQEYRSALAPWPRPPAPSPAPPGPEQVAAAAQEQLVSDKVEKILARARAIRAREAGKALAAAGSSGGGSAAGRRKVTSGAKARPVVAAGAAGAAAATAAAEPLPLPADSPPCPPSVPDKLAGLLRKAAALSRAERRVQRGARAAGLGASPDERRAAIVSAAKQCLSRAASSVREHRALSLRADVKEVFLAHWLYQHARGVIRRMHQMCIPPPPPPSPGLADLLARIDHALDSTEPAATNVPDVADHDPRCSAHWFCAGHQGDGDSAVLGADSCDAACEQDVIPLSAQHRHHWLQLRLTVAALSDVLLPRLASRRAAAVLPTIERLRLLCFVYELCGATCARRPALVSEQRYAS